MLDPCDQVTHAQSRPWVLTNAGKCTLRQALRLDLHRPESHNCQSVHLIDISRRSSLQKLHRG